MNKINKYEWQKNFNGFNENIKSDLTPIEKSILDKLVIFVDNKNGGCCPSYSTLSKISGYCISTIQKSIKNCCKKGWLSINKSPRKNGGYHNIYSISQPVQQYKKNKNKLKKIFSDSKNVLLSTEKLILYIIYDYLHLNKKRSYPLDYDELVKDTNLKKRTVQKHLKSLYEKEFLRITNNKLFLNSPKHLKE